MSVSDENEHNVWRTFFWPVPSFYFRQRFQNCLTDIERGRSRLTCHSALDTICVDTSTDVLFFWRHDVEEVGTFRVC